MDTIFALATAPGKSGLGVIRVSGPEAFDACRVLAGRVPPARMASLCRLRDAEGSTLDEALVLVFDAGASFTGEAVAEFHCHGSIAIVRAVLARLGRLPGLRMAEPGEFTRRALQNGRMDLTQVEALGDLIEAETETQRQQAVALLQGALGMVVEGWRTDLVRAAALLEVTIDFVDEDVPVDVAPEVAALIDGVVDGLDRELRGLDAAERVRTGFEVAIVGPPNAGKSTLLNYLAGREAAITSEIAGTTRDVIEVRLDIAGLTVTLLDTAGLREAEDAVERIGVTRARERAAAADMRIHLVVDDGQPDLEIHEGDIVLRSKDDAGVYRDGVSGVSGAGVPALIATIAERLGERVSGAGLVNRERHRIALTDSGVHLRAARDLLAGGVERYDVASEELRFGLRKLEALLGRVDVEHVLDQIFSSFCIGK